MQAEDAPMTWTDERIEMLRLLWGEGLSARLIAERLGGMTRNTVIGKLDRLGLLGSRTTHDADAAVPVSPSTGQAAASSTSGQEMPRRPIPIPAPPDTLEIQQRLVATGKDPSPVEPPRALPTQVAAVACEAVVGIQALNQATCRWPIGDPQRDGFGYCGARSLTGRPYCETHARLAYEPPRERRRAS